MDAGPDADGTRLVSAALRRAQEHYAAGDAETANGGAQLAEAIEELTGHCGQSPLHWRLASSPPLSGRLRELFGLLALAAARGDEAAGMRQLLDAVFALLAALCEQSVALRRVLAAEVAFAQPAYAYLKYGLRMQCGVESLTRGLTVLLHVTYEGAAPSSHTWTEGLLTFVVKEIVQQGGKPAPWVPLCLGILRNAMWSYAELRQRVLSSKSYAPLCRRLVGNLQDERTFVVISSVSVIYHCDRKIRDKLFASKHVSQAIQCVFNVFVCGGDHLTRQFAADMLLAVVAAPTYDDCLARYTQTSRALFKLLDVCAAAGDTMSFESQHKVLNLISRLLSGEETRGAAVKAAGRRPVCAWLARCLTVDCAPSTPVGRGAAAVLAALAPACHVSESRGLDQLAGSPVTDSVLRSVAELLLTEVDTSQPAELVAAANIRILAAVQLALALAAGCDAATRSEVCSSLGAPLLGHVAETQLASALAPGAADALDWLRHGVHALLTLLRLLAALFDYSETHREVYDRLMADDRVPRAVGLALRCDDCELRLAALAVVQLSAHRPHSFDIHSAARHAAGGPSLPTVASLPAPSAAAVVPRQALSNGENTDTAATASSVSAPKRSLSDTTNTAMSGSRFNAANNNHDLDQLISSIRSSIEMAEPKMSHLMQLYEKKIGELQCRERQLETAVDAKQHMLANSERMLAQHGADKKSTEQELATLRLAIADFERRSESSGREAASARRQREETAAQLAGCQKQLDKVRREFVDTKRHMDEEMTRQKMDGDNVRHALDQQRRENALERETHQALRKHYEDMKARFDEATHKVFEAEEAQRTTERHLVDMTDELRCVSEQHARCAEKDQRLADMERRYCQAEKTHREARNKLEVELAAQKERADSLSQQYNELQGSINKLAAIQKR